MIVTHTQNAQGQRRIYLGGKSSLEAYIAPRADNIGWTFHLDEAVTGNRLSEADRKAWAIHTLSSLSAELGVHPEGLAAVPFETIAALHTNSPFEGRRVAAGRRATINNGFMTTSPTIRKPSADFHTPERKPNRSVNR